MPHKPNLFEVVDSLHFEPMNDGSGRIRTYEKGEFCGDPWGRDLVKVFPHAFKYAPPGVSPKFEEGECDDFLDEVAAGQLSQGKKKLQKQVMKKAKQFLPLDEEEEVEEVEVEEEEVLDEEESLVVEDLDDESDEEETVEDDLEEEEEEEEAPKPKKKIKDKKKKKVKG